MHRSSIPKTLEVSIDSRVKAFKVNPKKITYLSSAIGASLRLQNCEMNIVLMGDHAIRKLNYHWRHKDKVTDVLSFPQNKFKAGEFAQLKRIKVKHKHLGDIAISIPQSERNARQFGHPLDLEFRFLLVHGVLHLLGYDHEKKQDELIMNQVHDRVQENLDRVLIANRWRSCVKRKKSK